jgi:Ni,Fe-hydrogenase I large subunit
MKPKSLALGLFGCVALATATLLPRESSGQAGAQEEALIQQVLADLAAQQTQLVDNQVKIDEKVALIAEEVRQARIYAGRAGGKAK